jgi:predicted lipid-binding transport protein (Tim44 family)
MRRLVLGFSAALLCAAFVVPDADAGRLGAGRSLGAQRSVARTPPTAAPAKPAQQPAAQPAAQPPGGATQPASGFGRWAPLVGGLALGGALGWLTGAHGVGGLMVGLLLLGLLVFGATALARMLAQKRGEAPQRFQYANAGSPGPYPAIGSETVAAPPPSQAAGFDPGSAVRPVHPGVKVPDGFDVAGFLKSAKLNYMRLQIANDRGDLEELREFTTDELFEELRRDVLARGGAGQQTDVLALNADLLEVVTEGDWHWASIRFSGSLRESPGEAPRGFEEVWNLSKPVSGGGWQLAGIQQMH